MVGWHHWLDGHEFDQALGVGDGQGSLACCRAWGHKESDTTEWLNWTDGKSCFKRAHWTVYVRFRIYFTAKVIILVVSEF